MWGRLDGRPAMLRADVWPLLEGKTIAETVRCLDACIAAGLLELHQSSEDRWIQVPDWEDKAGSIGKKDHRMASQWPDSTDQTRVKEPSDGAGPTPGQSRANAGPTPGQPSRARTRARAGDPNPEIEIDPEKEPENEKESCCAPSGVADTFEHPDPGPTAAAAPPRTNGHHAKPPAEPVKATPLAWTRAACDLWISRYGGTAPGGRIGKALKPLITKHGEDPVLTAFDSYLAQTEAAYASAERFASTYGQWSGNRPFMTQRTARSLAASQQWLADREARTGGAA